MKFSLSALGIVAATFVGSSVEKAEATFRPRPYASAALGAAAVTTATAAAAAAAASAGRGDGHGAARHDGGQHGLSSGRRVGSGSGSASGSFSGGASRAVLSDVAGWEDEEEEDAASAWMHPTTSAEEHSYLRSAALFQRSLQAPNSINCTNPSPGTIRGIFVVSQPNPIGITADGLTGDWDLTTAGYDYVTDMYQAGEGDPVGTDGRPNGNYLVVGKLYLRWSCVERKLCALVLTNDGYCISGTNNFFKDYGIGNSDILPLAPGFQNVSATAGKIVGWEACFGNTSYVPPVSNLCRTGASKGVEFHASFGSCSGGPLAGTASSGRVDDFIGIDLRCPCIGNDGSICTLPPPFPPLPPSSGTCCGDTCTPPDQACFCSCTTSIACPASTTVECGNSTLPAATGSATVTKDGSSCSSVGQDVNYTDAVSTTTPGVCPQKISRTWTAYLRCSANDPVGRTHTCVQEINVRDTEAPVLQNLPNDETLECQLPSDAVVSAVDKCQGPITPTLSTSDSPGCGTTKNVTRTWTATDSCLNTATATRLTRIVDTTRPVLHGVPSSTSASCDAIPAAASVSSIDTCDASVVPVLSESNTTVVGECQRDKTITRTWTATDDCTNSISASQTITLTDDVAPVFTSSPPPNTGISCDAELPEFGNLSATDSCGSATVTKVSEETPGSCPQATLVSRTWIAEDLCGNVASVSQQISIYDTTKPVLYGIPSSTSASCDAIPRPADVTTNDTCDASPTLDFEESNTTVVGECQAGKTVTRTWTSTDKCGNEETKVQVLTLTDTIDPVFTADPPADTAISCDAALPLFGDLTANDTCGSATVSKTEVETPGSCLQEKLIIRTWKAKDLCGNEKSVSQQITIYDDAAPTLSGVPDNTIASCDAIPSPDAVFAIDECDEEVVPVLVESNTTVVGQCQSDKTIIRTWTATDDCTNSISASQTITLTDNIAPVFTADPPANAAYSCEAVLPPFGDLLATDTCGSASVSKAEVETPGSCPQAKRVTRTWTAVDLCGNNVSVSQNISVYDRASPVLSSVPASRSASCDDIPAAATVTANDACDPSITPSFSESSSTVEGECKRGKTIIRTWTASDDCGNEVSASQTITLTDNTAPVLYDLPANATVECSAIPAPPTVAGSDSCGGDVNITMVETLTTGLCANRKVTRVWTGLDVCLNEAKHTQVLTVVDTTKPTLTCPAAAVIACDGCTSATESCLGVPTLSDNCDLAPNLTFADVYTPATLPPMSSTDANQTLSRTYTVRDDCGNTQTCLQTITKTNVLAQFTVKRTVNGAVAPSATITFELYQAPANGGYSSGSPIAIASTFGDADGVILSVFLNPALPYTICERSVPAAWTTTFTLNGAAVTAYDPDGPKVPPESLGNYCYDFLPTNCAGVFNVVVDNSFGVGGCPRTPGYWKNWNNCTGGKQGATAAKNGGAAKGYFIVEDLLPIVWDDINADAKFFKISTCAVAVQVLSTKTLTTCLSNANQQLASDPVVNLAKHLLASQLNAKAGACISADVNATIKSAEKLLDSLNYLGCKLATAPNATVVTLLRNYATYLDGYNNGNICPGCNG